MNVPVRPSRPEGLPAPGQIQITVLAFARAREAVGGSRLPLSLPAGSTVDACLDEIGNRHAAIAAMRPGLLLAVNEAYAHGSTPLRDGDTVALIPPVSGG